MVGEVEGCVGDEGSHGGLGRGLESERGAECYWGSMKTETARRRWLRYVAAELWRRRRRLGDEKSAQGGNTVGYRQERLQKSLVLRHDRRRRGEMEVREHVDTSYKNWERLIDHIDRCLDRTVSKIPSIAYFLLFMKRVVSKPGDMEIEVGRRLRFLKMCGCHLLFDTNLYTVSIIYLRNIEVIIHPFEMATLVSNQFSNQCN